jgi:hypothetical protein
MSGMKLETEVIANDFDIVLTTIRVLYSEKYKAEVKKRQAGQSRECENVCCLFEDFFWHRVVFDEFHEMETQDAEQIKSILGFSSRFWWGLTGTPKMDTVRSVVGIASLFKIDLVGVSEAAGDVLDELQHAIKGGMKEDKFLPVEKDLEAARLRDPEGLRATAKELFEEEEGEESPSKKKPKLSVKKSILPSKSKLTVKDLEASKKDILPFLRCNVCATLGLCCYTTLLFSRHRLKGVRCREAFLALFEKLPFLLMILLS